MSCAIRNGGLFRFHEDHPSYCHEHRPQQCLPLNYFEKPCGICLKEVDVTGGATKWLHATCCGGLFHFSCVDRLAQSSGYFFKCPLCNSVDRFNTEMKMFGIYVPEQDAAWEMDSTAFENLLQRHGTCDASVCACPGSRETDDVDTIWEILLCSLCGSEGRQSLIFFYVRHTCTVYACNLLLYYPFFVTQQVLTWDAYPVSHLTGWLPTTKSGHVCLAARLSTVCRLP